MKKPARNVQHKLSFKEVRQKKHKSTHAKAKKANVVTLRGLDSITLRGFKVSLEAEEPITLVFQALDRL